MTENTIRNLIADTFAEAKTFGLGKLSIREHAFLQSIFNASQRNGFNGLSGKQASWLNAIASKLEATKGKDMCTVLAERCRASWQAQRNSYYATMYGR